MLSLQFLYFFLILSVGIVLVQSQKYYGYGAKGQLICNSQKLAGAAVAIFIDKEFREWLEPYGSAILDEGWTDEEGKFSLSGSIEIPENKNFSQFKPELRIIHMCNDGDMPCHVMELIAVPMSYIHSGPEKEDLKFEPFFDIGSKDVSDRPAYFFHLWRQTCWHDFHGN